MPCFLSTKKQDCIVQQAVFRNCPKQNNSHDCGLFAVAVIWHLLEGKEIHSSVFTQDHIGALREALCRGLLPNAEWATLESVSSFFPALLPPLRNEPSPDQDGALVHETGPEVEEPKEDEEVVAETHPENLIHDVEDEIFARKFSEPSQVFQTVEELMVVINDYQETSGNFLAIRRSPSDNRIQRVFVCPSFANDVLMCVRPVISIDGAHMRSEWKGTLYLATVKSAGDDLYPVAFAITMDGEDFQGWLWFLQHLKATAPNLIAEHFRRECREKSPADTAPAEIPRRLQIRYGYRRESLDGLCIAGRRETASQVWVSELQHFGIRK